MSLTIEEATGRLRMAAAGREEYATSLEGAENPSLIEQREALQYEAALLRDAARVVEGDLGPLYRWLPSWWWTEEMVGSLTEGRERWGGT